MCEYFVKADPIQYEQRSRTVRIKNVLTSIRLENMVWDILAEMAEEEGCTTNALISKFHDEILAHRGEVPNFASFLRVTSMRYLRRCVITMERQQAQAMPVANVMSIPSRPQALETAPKAVTAVGR
jgi:predicted DNA-binding ribbon-helix-helix protein